MVHKRGRSTGLTGVSGEELETAGAAYEALEYHLFLDMWRADRYPQLFATQKESQVPKPLRPTHELYNDMRPFSVKARMALIFDRIIYDRLETAEVAVAADTGRRFVGGFVRGVGPPMHVAVILEAARMRAVLGKDTLLHIKDVHEAYPNINRYAVVAALIGIGLGVAFVSRFAMKGNRSGNVVATPMGVSPLYRSGIGAEQGANSSVSCFRWINIWVIV